MQQQPGQPGTVGPQYNALLFQAQGQMPGTGQAILAPRLALVQGSGGRPPGVSAGAATFRTPGPHAMPMGMLLKAPPRKTGGGGQQKGRKHCNCKNSRCLKLYCECFASGRYCDNCNCVSCFNNKESESVRQAAVEAILERNPNAFRPKIQTAEGDTHPQSVRNAPDGTVRHTKGCNCKKSACLKKYCECFQGGIYCTEVCKCVECKNYDGSEARAQVLSIQEPFNVHQLHQAAAQQALKRPRLQVSQPLMQQSAGSAGLLQAQNALQHLAAAAAAGGPGAPTMPLQQLQAMSAAAAAAATAPPAAPAAPQPPPPPVRHPLLDVVHDLVKPAMIEELCQLLILVAKEEADKQQQQEQQKQHIDSMQPEAAADGATPNGVKRENGSEPGTEPAAAGHENGLAAADGVDAAAVAGQQSALVKSEAGVRDADGDSVMQEASPLQNQQQQPSTPAPEGLTDSYAAQEAVVLHEFNAILQRIVAQAEKKANSIEAANTAAAAEAAAAAAGAAAAAAAAGAGGSAAASSQLPSASTVAGAGDVAEHQQQQQQQQQPRPMAVSMRPQVLGLPQHTMTQQQAMMYQAAANSNLAYAQLQASRHAAFLNVNAMAAAAAGGGQQLAAFPGGGLGVQLSGLRPMGVGMQQMVQVMAQDGSVHHIPAHSLMSLLQPAAAAQAAPAQPAAAVSVPAAPVAAAVPAAGGVAPPTSAAQPAGVGVSLLSLLNGAINTSTASGSS